MTDSFIKQQQEKARTYVKQNFVRGIHQDKLDTLTAQIIRNTCEEIERRAERVMEYPNGNFDGLWLYRGKLKDILTSITTSHE